MVIVKIPKSALTSKYDLVIYFELYLKMESLKSQLVRNNCRNLSGQNDPFVRSDGRATDNQFFPLHVQCSTSFDSVAIE
jgi:hypothetical protein